MYSGNDSQLNLIPSESAGARNILDAFHQADQEFLLARLDGSEADSAVAHDDGRDPRANSTDLKTDPT